MKSSDYSIKPSKCSLKSCNYARDLGHWRSHQYTQLSQNEHYTIETWSDAKFPPNTDKDRPACQARWQRWGPGSLSLVKHQFFNLNVSCCQVSTKTNKTKITKDSPTCRARQQHCGPGCLSVVMHQLFNLNMKCCKVKKKKKDRLTCQARWLHWDPGDWSVRPASAGLAP